MCIFVYYHDNLICKKNVLNNLINGSEFQKYFLKKKKKKNFWNFNILGRIL